MPAKKKHTLGSRQTLILGLIYDEPFITFDELSEEMRALFPKRGSHGLALTLGSMETHGWITSKSKSYLATRIGKEAYLATQNEA